MTSQVENPLDAEPYTTCVVDGCDHKFRSHWRTFGFIVDDSPVSRDPLFLRREHCSSCAKANPDMMKRWFMDFIEKNKDALIANGNLDEETYNKKKQEMKE